MKKIFLIAGLLMVPWSSHNGIMAQEPEWVWAKSFGGSGRESENDFIIDHQGNLYVVGQFSSNQINFGNFVLTTEDTSHYVVKFNSDGEGIWGKSLGSWIPYSSVYIYSVAVDSEESVYITGEFYGPWTFANTAINSDNFKFFLAKYDMNGNELWIKTYNEVISNGYRIKIDSEDYIIVTGEFQETLIIDNITLSSNGGHDVFVAKFDQSGSILWAKSFGGNGHDFPNDLTINPANNILLTGDYDSATIHFGNEIITKHNANPDSYELFITKFASDGQEIWIKNAGGSDSAVTSSSIIIDNDESIYIQGSFWGSSIEIGHTTLIASSESASFIIKLQEDGDVLWAKTIFDEFDFISGYAKAHSGIYILGFSENSSIDFGNFILYSESEDPYYFIAKMNTDGSFNWATASGGNTSATFGRIAVNLNNDIYICATFNEPSIMIGSTKLISEVHSDVFLAKLYDSTVGINSIETQNFTLYPNPFASQATLISAEKFQNATLTITNALGQVVKKMENVYGNQIIIERKNLPSGVYYLNVSENGISMISKKIVIQ